MVKIILALALFLTVSVARANNLMMGPPNTTTADVRSTKILNQSNLRAYFMIINTGSNTVYVKFSNTAQTGVEGIPIPAGWFYENTSGPSNAIWLETEADTSTVFYMEGQ